MKKQHRSVFKLRWIIALIVVGAFVFSMPLLRVWQHIITIKLAREISRLQEETEKLSTAKAIAQIEVDALLSHQSIERTAQEQFGMVYPTPEQVVFISAQPKPRPAAMGHTHRPLKKGDRDRS